MPHLSLKRVVALGLAIAIAALAITGTAAAYDAYWAKAGNSYSCQGYPGGTICKSRIGYHYQVLIDNSGVTVYQGAGKHPAPQFACKWGCTDLRMGE